MADQINKIYRFVKVMKNKKKAYYRVYDIEISEETLNFNLIAIETGLNRSTIHKAFKKSQGSPETVKKIYKACLELYKNAFNVNTSTLYIDNNITQSKSLVNS